MCMSDSRRWPLTIISGPYSGRLRAGPRTVKPRDRCGHRVRSGLLRRLWVTDLYSSWSAHQHVPNVQVELRPAIASRRLSHFDRIQKRPRAGDPGPFFGHPCFGSPCLCSFESHAQIVDQLLMQLYFNLGRCPGHRPLHGVRTPATVNGEALGAASGMQHRHAPGSASPMVALSL